jgi:hypothetical protein
MSMPATLRAELSALDPELVVTDLDLLAGPVPGGDVDQQDAQGRLAGAHLTPGAMTTSRHVTCSVMRREANTLTVVLGARLLREPRDRHAASGW